MCKFGLFCSYKHNNLKTESAERKLEIEVRELQKEITTLKLSVDLLKENLLQFENFVKDAPSTSGNLEKENTIAKNNHVKENIIEISPVKVACLEPLLNVSLGTIIRANSCLLRKKCEYKTKSKKDLRIHVVRVHSKITQKQNRRVYS